MPRYKNPPGGGFFIARFPATRRQFMIAVAGGVPYFFVKTDLFFLELKTVNAQLFQMQ
jgi:hypothetical protein